MRKPKPKPKYYPYELKRLTRREILDQFKKKLDKILRPLGFDECTVEYDIRLYRIIVRMSHKFPVERQHVSVWTEPDYRVVRPDTLMTLPKIETVESEIWRCQYEISEECFAFDEHKYLLQQCARFIVDRFTQVQLSKVTS